MQCYRNYGVKQAILLTFLFVSWAKTFAQEQQEPRNRKNATVTTAQAPEILQCRIDFQIYSGETLESIIRRLENQLNSKFGYHILVFKGYKAKPAHYIQKECFSILDDQLANTAVSYKIEGGKLVFHQ